MTEPELSVVVVSYNSRNFLEGNLKSLESQVPAFKEIVFVDNSSQDGSREWLAGQPRIHCHLLKENRGYAAAANIGISQCSARFVLVANADIILESGFTGSVLDFLKSHPDTGLLSPLILRFDGETIDSAGQTCSRAFFPRERGYGKPLDHYPLKTEPIFSVCGAATIINRDAFTPIISGNSFYDESYFMFWEDFDLGWTATENRIPVWFCPQARVRHFRSATLKPGIVRKFSLSLARPPQIRFHLVKNRYLTLIKHFRWNLHWRNLPALLLKDLLWVGLLTITAPRTIILLLRSGYAFRQAFAKRKRFRSHLA